MSYAIISYTEKKATRNVEKRFVDFPSNDDIE